MNWQMFPAAATVMARRLKVQAVERSGVESDQVAGLRCKLAGKVPLLREKVTVFMQKSGRKLGSDNDFLAVMPHQVVSLFMLCRIVTQL